MDGESPHYQLWIEVEISKKFLQTWDALDDKNSLSPKLGGNLQDKISSCKLP